MSEKKRELGYNEDLDPTDQVDAEEWIAALIYDSEDALTEEGSKILSKMILEEILWRFSPEYFSDEED